MQADKFLQRVLSGRSDANLDFAKLCNLLNSLGFQQRIEGSHHIFFKEGIDELINLQREGRHAKRYQIRQVRAVLVKYGLGETQ